jgi:uncharacterized protein (UPF0264 family)
MSFIQLFAKIPWKHVIGYAPEIVGVAQKIYENVRKTLGMSGKPGTVSLGARGLSLAGLELRVERLETNELQQAELVRDMARQVGELSAALGIVSRRLALATALAFASLAGVIILAFKT